VEFFPEEGKYHLDGHAKCGPALTPSQTREAKGICPVCGKPVTVGVLSRVYELADREVPPVADMLPDWHCVPLLELLGQVLDMGTASKEVQSAYQKAVAELGGELEILLDVPIELIKERAGPVLARAVEKARDGVVELKGGYDGVYGTVQVLSRSERLELAGGGLLFGHNPVRRGRPPRLAEAPKAEPLPKAPVVKRREAGGSVLGELTDEQTAAVTFRGGDLVVLAGPGSGKTMTLTRRAAYLTARGDGAALVTTYTRKAAETLLARISRLDPEGRIRVTTLHALALAELNRQKQNFRLASPEAQEDCLARAARSPDVSTRRLAATVSRMKSRLEPIDSPEYEAYRESIKKYQRNLEREGLIDFDDLINLAIQLDYRGLFAHVLADEFQDFTLAQVRLLDRLAPKGGLTVIGDPDQSVYGFRGALENPVETLGSIRGPAAKLCLTRNFRSNPAICRAAEKVRPASTGADIVAARKIPLEPIGRATVDAPWDESAFVVSRIRAHLGVTDLGPRGGSAHESEAIPDLTLGDIAILFRIRRQGEEFARALAEAGLPWQMAGEAELTATDGLDFTAEKISLLTMHAAKGLEFRLVFVTGVEAGLTPLHLDEERLIPSDHAEERRLFYVALTRAKDKLYLTRCAKRSLWGRMSTGGNSPFWRLVPGALTFDHDPAPASRRLRRGPKGPPPGPRLF
jgi:DNA helicase-2/ATP-dependent DNA helicase PcrA